MLRLSALTVAALLYAAPSAAQALDATMGKELYPMLYLESYDIAGISLDSFPEEPWRAAVTCLAQQGAYSIRYPAELVRPALGVVPIANTIRVQDGLLDSLLAPTGALLGRFQNPVVAYTLLRPNVVLVTRQGLNPQSLRHEALHVILWQTRRLYGHPPEYFGPCDSH